MLEQIKRDLARDLNTEPHHVVLISHTQVDGNHVRVLSVAGQCFRITTDVQDQNYLNIEPVENYTRVTPAPQNDFHGRPIRDPWLTEQFHQLRNGVPIRRIPAENLPNTAESVVNALGLQGWRRVARATFEDYTIRVFVDREEGYILTAQNAQEIIDITQMNANVESSLNERLREFMDDRAVGNEQDINLFIEFVNRDVNRSEFVFSCLSEILERDPSQALAPIIRDIHKLLNRRQIEVVDDEASSWQLYPRNSGEATTDCSFRVSFKSAAGGFMGQWRGIELVSD